MEVPVFVSASQILARLLTVDSDSSGLNANTLQGYVATDFALASALSGYQPLDAELTALSGLTSAANTVPSFTGSGTAALLTVGTGANNLVQLTAASKLPAVDGSLLTNLPSGGSPGGSNTQIQFNDSSAFGGDSGLTYNKTTDFLTIAGGLINPVWRPASDSTTALQMQNAAGTAVVTVNTTTPGVRVANGSDYIEFVNESGNPTIRLFNSGLIDATIKATNPLTPRLEFNTAIAVNGEITTTAAFNAIQLIAQSASTPYLRIFKTGVHWFDWNGTTNNKFRLLDVLGAQLMYIEDTVSGSASYGRVAIGTQTNPHALLDLAASNANRAHLHFRSGTAPTGNAGNPFDGDVWFDGTDLKMRVAGVTKTFTLV